MGESPYIDAENQEVLSPGPAENVGQQWLTSRSGTNLRQEAVTPNGRAKSWAEVTDAFKNYIWKEWEAADTWEDEKDVRPTTHRFGHQYACDYRGTVLGVDRAVSELFDSVTTAMTVRRAMAFGVRGQPQPPADHLQDLLTANGYVFSAYRRHLQEKDYRFVRVTVLEPHRNGYIHAHDGLWIDGDVSVERFSNAIEAHLRHVDQAKVSNHRLSDAVDVRSDPERQQFPDDPEDTPPSTALPRELTKQFGGFAPFRDPQTGSIPDRNPNVPPVLQAPQGRLRGYALLWATNTRHYRPDRSLYPTVVKASQEMYGPIEDIDQATVPDLSEQFDSGGNTGVGMVDVDARPVEFQSVDGGKSLSD